MSKAHWTCAVAGCTAANVSMHNLPRDTALRQEWVNFIFSNEVPENVSQHLRLCTAHFSPDCIENQARYNAGFASKLILTPGAVPTVLNPASDIQQVSQKLPTFTREVGCQTDPPKTERRTVCTQLGTHTLLHNHVKSRATQVSVATTSIGVGSNAISPPVLPILTSTPEKYGTLDSPPSKRAHVDYDDSTEVPEDDDSTYNPGDSVVTESTILSQTPASIHETPKYIVFEDCLMTLFETCPICRMRCQVQKIVRGTFLSVDQSCLHCLYNRKWMSQPLLGSTPAGNLQLSAAILFSGSSFIQTKKVLNTMRVKTISSATFHVHARSYLQPTIFYKWKTDQEELLQSLRQKETVSFAGDMRADSPGHSAKYGCYSMMELDSNVIVDIQMVQSNEVGGSGRMEKEGLKRSLQFLEESGLTVGCLVTDRHPQIQKFVREEKPAVIHYYDVWHVAKSVSRKLEVIAKQCKKVKKWQRSITNHMYWSATTAASGKETVAKWSSLINHMHNIHTHEDPLFPKCVHPDLTETHGNKWFQPGNATVYKVEKALLNKRILKDVEKLSPQHQTSALEAFHSVILRFAPKNVHFPFVGMLCRHYLAGMHFNENADRSQAISSTGQLAYMIKYPKSKKGQYSIQALKTKPTYNYRDALMTLLFIEVFQNPGPYTAKINQMPVPENLNAQYERPVKADAIASYVSRFSH